MKRTFESFQICRWLFFYKLAVHNCVPYSSSSLQFQQSKRDNMKTKNVSPPIVVSGFRSFSGKHLVWQQRVTDMSTIRLELLCVLMGNSHSLHFGTHFCFSPGLTKSRSKLKSPLMNMLIFSLYLFIHIYQWCATNGIYSKTLGPVKILKHEHIMVLGKKYIEIISQVI